MVTGILHQLIPVIVSVYITPRFFAPVARQKAAITFLENFWLALHTFFDRYRFLFVGAMVSAPLTDELEAEFA